MSDDDDFGADADFLAALVASSSSSAPRTSQPTPQRISQPIPQRITQSTPQRLDRAPPTSATSSDTPKIVQPTPQALVSRSTTGASILVSPRQKGNPILTSLRSFPWEYSDIPADYVLGTTTCALFLSLKYHRLHPEYIYNRIKDLRDKYNLRVLLTMVDIDNHEESLKELSKTSLVNKVTVILCWSAAEAARYLELYKSYEHANFKAIRGSEATGYAEQMVEFVTVPRSVNKTDAVTLVSAFGSVKGAVNARPEEVAVLGGWGEKKVRAWCTVVDEPFRARKATRREVQRELGNVLDSAVPLGRVPLRETQALRARERAEKVAAQSEREVVEQFQLWDPDDDVDGDDEEAMIEAVRAEEERLAQEKKKDLARREGGLSDGIAAALARLREKG